MPPDAPDVVNPPSNPTPPAAPETVGGGGGGSPSPAAPDTVGAPVQLPTPAAPDTIDPVQLPAPATIFTAATDLVNTTAALSESQKASMRGSLDVDGIRRVEITGDVNLVGGIDYHVSPQAAANNSGKFSGSDYILVNSIAAAMAAETSVRLVLQFKTAQTVGDISANILFSMHDVSGGNKLRVGVAPTDGGIFVGAEALTTFEVSMSGGFNDDAWHSLDLTMVNGQLVTCLVDGNNISTPSGRVANIDFANITQVSIGHEWDAAASGDRFQGEIRGIEIYAGASLEARFPLNGLVGEGVLDTSGNGHVATLIAPADHENFFAGNTREVTMTLPAADGANKRSLVHNVNGETVKLVPPVGQKLNAVTDGEFVSMTRGQTLSVVDAGTDGWLVTQLTESSHNTPLFVYLSDSHVFKAGNSERFIATAQKIRNMQPDAVIHGGDLVDDNFDGTDAPGGGYAAWFGRNVAKLGCPWFQVLGNHDAINNSEATAAQAHYPDSYQLDHNDGVAHPGYYHFSKNGIDVIVLATTLESGDATGDYDLSAVQMTWLQTTLDALTGADRRLLVFCHVSPANESTSAHSSNSLSRRIVTTTASSIRSKLRDWQAAHGLVLAVLSGHDHYNRRKHMTGIDFLTINNAGGNYTDHRNDTYEQTAFHSFVTMQWDEANKQFVVRGHHGAESWTIQK